MPKGFPDNGNAQGKTAPASKGRRKNAECRNCLQREGFVALFLHSAFFLLPFLPYFLSRQSCSALRAHSAGWPSTD